MLEAIALALLPALPGFAGLPPPPPPRFSVDRYDLVCKLLNSSAYGAPTANDTEHKYNIAGADLGYSVGTSGRVWIFFGDTMGFRDYWAVNGPDSVGYVDASPADL